MVIEIVKGEKLILPILYARTYIGEHSVDSSLFTESVEYDLLVVYPYPFVKSAGGRPNC